MKILFITLGIGFIIYLCIIFLIPLILILLKRLGIKSLTKYLDAKWEKILRYIVKSLNLVLCGFIITTFAEFSYKQYKNYKLYKEQKIKEKEQLKNYVKSLNNTYFYIFNISNENYYIENVLSKKINKKVFLKYNNNIILISDKKLNSNNININDEIILDPKIIIQLSKDQVIQIIEEEFD